MRPAESTAVFPFPQYLPIFWSLEVAVIVYKYLDL